MATTASSRTSGPVRGYRDLIVWQDSMDLVVAIYQTTTTFPKEERYGGRGLTQHEINKFRNASKKHL